MNEPLTAGNSKYELPSRSRPTNFCELDQRPECHVIGWLGGRTFVDPNVTSFVILFKNPLILAFALFYLHIIWEQTYRMTEWTIQVEADDEWGQAKRR